MNRIFKYFDIFFASFWIIYTLVAFAFLGLIGWLVYEGIQYLSRH